MITFDALHSVKANVTWLVEAEQAQYVAAIKTNQPSTWAQLDGLRWTAVPIQHTASNTGHGRRESRSVKTVAVNENLGGIAFPHAKLALRIHRRRKKSGEGETRETVYAGTSLDTHQATPAELATYLRGHWAVENSATTSGTSPLARTPPRFTPTPRPGPWPSSGTSRSAPSKPHKHPTWPKPPEPSATTPNEPSRSRASPTTQPFQELDQTLIRPAAKQQYRYPSRHVQNLDALDVRGHRKDVGFRGRVRS